MCEDAEEEDVGGRSLGEKEGFIAERCVCEEDVGGRSWGRGKYL